MRRKKPAEESIGIDIDPQIIAARHEDLGDACRLICSNATTWLQEQSFKGDELVYCDPPYLRSTRRSERVYRHEMSERQHIDLLTALRRLPGPVILSGYASDLYDELLCDWRTVTFRAKTHAGVRIETLWMNFETPSQLHDYSCLGSNFREREAIRRRVASIQARIERLPDVERACLAAWLSEQVADRMGVT